MTYTGTDDQLPIHVTYLRKKEMSYQIVYVAFSVNP